MAEAAPQHLRRQRGAAHAEQHDAGEPLAADLLRECLQVIENARIRSAIVSQPRRSAISGGVDGVGGDPVAPHNVASRTSDPAGHILIQGQRELLGDRVL